MKYPDQVIVGVGGTHLDFLLACFRIMVGETPILTRVGKVRIESKLREEVIGQHANGNRDYVFCRDYKNTECCHLWSDRMFGKWPTNFIIITFNEQILDILLDVRKSKGVGKNNPYLFTFKKSIENYLRSKLPIDEITRNLIIKQRKDMLECKNARFIKMQDIYHRENVADLLREYGVYNVKYARKFEEFYDNWYNLNKTHIDKINTLTNKG